MEQISRPTRFRARLSLVSPTCCGARRSVPPRGSGWLSDAHLWPYEATRYRTVVLTSWHRSEPDCGSKPW